MADVLVPTVTDRIDAGLVAQAGEQMKLIANFGNGIDNIDVTSALRRGITVTNTPGVLTDDDGRHDHGPDPGGRAPDRGRRAVHSFGRMGRLVADLDARPPHNRQEARHRRHGPHRPGDRPARPRAFGLEVHYHNRRRVAQAATEQKLEATYWDRSTRCWRASISSRSIARIRRRPTTCCRPSPQVSETAGYRREHGARRDHRREMRWSACWKRASWLAGLDVFEHEPAVSPKLVKLAKSGR